MTDAKKEDKKEPTEKPKSDVSKETHKGAEEELKIKRKQINEIEKEIKEQHELFNTDYNIIDTRLQDVDDMDDPQKKERWRQITKPDEGVPGGDGGGGDGGGGDGGGGDGGARRSPSSSDPRLNSPPRYNYIPPPSNRSSTRSSRSSTSSSRSSTSSSQSDNPSDDWLDSAEAADRGRHLPVSSRLSHTAGRTPTSRNQPGTYESVSLVGQSRQDDAPRSVLAGPAPARRIQGDSSQEPVQALPIGPIGSAGGVRPGQQFRVLGSRGPRDSAGVDPSLLGDPQSRAPLGSGTINLSTSGLR